MDDTIHYIETIAMDVACVWFAFWGLRRKYELDEKLDRRAWMVRLTIVLIGLVSLLFRSPEFMYERLIFGIAAAAVIVWPNFAYRISRIGKKD
jgi:hypothetical protein